MGGHWWVRAGVVFNEMKGVYSQPDSMLARYTQQALFPDNTYGVDSGGDPSVIPDLTFAEFQDFHRKFYHPSNARIWFYGDDPLDKRLEILHSETPHLNQDGRREARKGRPAAAIAKMTRSCLVPHEREF